MGNPLEPGEYLCTFDSTFQDTSSTFNGTSNGGPSFSTSTVTGYGSSLSLKGSLTRSVSINELLLALFNRSRTFEAWIYLSNGTSGLGYPIIGQCDVPSLWKCLHLVVQDQKLLLGFYEDDLRSDTNLTASQWYHTAFTFDSVTRNQSIYLDGVSDGNRLASQSYQGANGKLNIGYSTGYNSDG